MSTVLAFGATGPIAGLAFAELVRRRARVRAFVRTEAARARVLGLGAAEAVVGDLADPESTRAALRGVSRVFYIAPVGLPDEAATGARLVDQAKQAGVRRFVFSSVIHPVIASLPNHAGKAPVEEALVASGLEYAILHPAVFYQNLAAAWPRIAGEHVLAEPWSNATRHSRVDYRDVADVAATALLDDRLVDGTFELCAPGALDRHEIAAMLTEITGRPIEARRTDPDSLPPEMAALKPMFAHYDRHGLRGSPLTLRAILGHEPRGLRPYLEELARAGG